MSVSFLPTIPKYTKPGWVYALFCQSDEGIGYVKIGHSVDPFGRLSALAGAAPFKAEYCAIAKFQSAGYAADVEESLHYAFRSRRVGGEWFKFELQNPADKAEFHDVSAKYIRAWVKFPFVALKEQRRLNSLSAFHAAKGKSPKGGTIYTSPQAWNELRNYGRQKV